MIVEGVTTARKESSCAVREEAAAKIKQLIEIVCPKKQRITLDTFFIPALNNSAPSFHERLQRQMKMHW